MKINWNSKFILYIIYYKYALQFLPYIHCYADLKTDRIQIDITWHSPNALIDIPAVLLILNKSQSVPRRQLLCNVTLATFGFTSKITSWRGVRHCLSAARNRGNYATRIGPLWCMWQHIKSDHWQSRKYSNTHMYLCGYIFCVYVCAYVYVY